MDANPSSPAAPPLPKPTPRSSRSRLEFWLVRGGIVVLLLLVAVQAHARFGYEMSLKRMQARLAAEPLTGDELELLVRDVPQCIVGWPSCSEESERHWRVKTYSWHGLTETFKIHLPYDSSDAQPAVLSVVTANPPPLEPVPMVELSLNSRSPQSHEGEPGMTGSPGMGGGTGNGGGQRPDIMTNDTNGDGKVSRDEAPERMAQFFDRIDANGDGFIDAEEAAAARNRRGSRQSGGSATGGRPNRPPGDEPAPGAAQVPTADPVDAAAPENG